MAARCSLPVFPLCPSPRNPPGRLFSCTEGSAVEPDYKWLVLIPFKNREHAEAVAQELRDLWPTVLVRAEDLQEPADEAARNQSATVAALCWLAIGLIVAALYIIPAIMGWMH
mgnify:CR=1 FL=1